MAAIELQGVTKRFGDITALNDLDLTVKDGEIYGFLGPNGAGKSTTINVLLDFVRPTAGTATVLGHDAREESTEIRQRVGVLPEGYHVYDRLTGRQHLQFAIDSKNADDDPDELLARVGIADAADRKAGGYSKGMAQRLVLGMALVGQPDLLILDEPTAGVDVELRHDLWEIITELNDDGTTILLTTHYIEEAERLCDTVAIMDQGEKLTVASPESLMARGNDTIRLRLESPPTHPPDIDDERIQEMTIEGDSLVVTAPTGGEVAPALVRSLDRQGHTVIDMDISRTSLEEVFVSLTSTDDTESTPETEPATPEGML